MPLCIVMEELATIIYLWPLCIVMEELAPNIYHECAAIYNTATMHLCLQCVTGEQLATIHCLVDVSVQGFDGLLENNLQQHCVKDWGDVRVLQSTTWARHTSGHSVLLANNWPRSVMHRVDFSVLHCVT